MTAGAALSCQVIQNGAIRPGVTLAVLQQVLQGALHCLHGGDAGVQLLHMFCAMRLTLALGGCGCATGPPIRQSRPSKTQVAAALMKRSVCTSAPVYCR